VRFVRRRLTDRVTRVFVKLGGLAIIVSILAIFAVIVLEALPLFKTPRSKAVPSIPARLDGVPLAVGTDEYRELIYAVTPSGVKLLSGADGTPQDNPSHPGLEGASVAGVSDRGRGVLALGLSDGRALSVTVGFHSEFLEAGRKKVTSRVKTGTPVALHPDRKEIRLLAFAPGESEALIAGAVGPREVALVVQARKKNLMGQEKMEEFRQTFPVPTAGEIRSLSMDGRGDDLYAGTSAGAVVRIDLRNREKPRVAETVLVGRNGAAVGVLGFLLGDRTLVAGDAAGGVSSWQLVRAGEDWRLTRMHAFAGHAAPVVTFSASQRGKGFLTGDAAGELRMHYGTTGETLLEMSTGGGLAAAAIAPKSNGVIALGTDGRFSLWTVTNPHPEITLTSLFFPVWYEGYDKPECVWQSTGGTDDFEPKFSLYPLIYGTIKGTIYAMLVAIPLALLGALYVSQFMHPTLKATVKPVVEVMAALPSVVVGFIAALWLAPRVEAVVPGLALLPVVLTALILAALWSWRAMPLSVRRRIKPGAEIFLLVPIVFLGAWLSFEIGGLLEGAWLGGDYRGWLRKFAVVYDQRNSIVVGSAMGFAVIPIIFTISEDSLSNVPGHLTAGSLALGATRWQTAIRIVLPTGSPGIFSAVMIGFGRAVGETMIVLMATGNTPVMDLSIFNGFRAMSANVAVELPEAPEGGTLFRVLFLAAFLLFLMTFSVNTLAEMIRLRLRRRYQTL
jgi:phosphate transport system permease protein